MVLEEKIMALVRLATDKGASEQEQRTAAVAACKLIRENGLSVAKKQPPSRTEPKTPRATKTKYNPHKKTVGEVIVCSYLATRCGKCSICKRSYDPWDPVADIKGKPVHFACAILQAAS